MHASAGSACLLVLHVHNNCHMCINAHQIFGVYHTLVFPPSPSERRGVVNKPLLKISEVCGWVCSLSSIPPDRKLYACLHIVKTNRFLNLIHGRKSMLAEQQHQ
jgi:hypothetical protein